MMYIDGELVPKVVIVESIQAHTEQELKKVEMDELKRVQFAAKCVAEFLSMDVAQRQVNT